MFARALCVVCITAAARVSHGSFVSVGTPAQDEASPASGVAGPPYYLLKPSNFAEVLGDDLPWAQQNIPLFESANSTLDLVYYFRWRTYKSHIHPTNCTAGQQPSKDCKNRTDGIDFVVTEFSPNVPWAGQYNTINCAAGHHMLEGGWLRSPVYMDSYTRWWVTNEARHNYYYWFATALRRNFLLTGDTALLKEVVPAYKAQFAQYATGALPSNHGASEFSSEHDCLWNEPGNEGQEQSISGSGCRTLIQSVMYGEASALAELCAAIGDEAGATEMVAEAERWQRRVLALWNPAIEAFDTLRMPHPTLPACDTYKTKVDCPTPRCEFSTSGKCQPPPPPPPPPPPAPVPGYELLPDHNGTFCCDQTPCVGGHSTFLHQGPEGEAACFGLCTKNPRCKYATWHSNPNNIGSWCFNAQYCNKTNYFDGTKTPGIMGDTHTWEKGNTASTAATHQQEHQQEEAKATLHQTSPPAAATLAGVRELASLSSPWYFGAVPVENASVYASSWDTAFDPDGLGAPFGLRTAEKRNPRYFCDKKRPGAGGGCCNWSGPMWPFETAKAISAAIRVLNSYSSAHMSQEKLWTMMWQYAASHTPLWKVINTTNGEFCNLDDPHSDLKSWLLPGTQNSWIAESGCADTNDMGHPAWTDVAEEGYEYNHSTFNDLILSGLVGLWPGPNGHLTVNPLIPATILPWWRADGIQMHGKIISVSFDLDGSHYKQGKGLQVFVDGKLAKSSPTMAKLEVQL